jgi:hypothetical protein
MSTKHVHTTGDLVRFGCALRVECTHCSSTRTFDAAEVATDAGNVGIKRLGRRLRCIRCGMKAAKVVMLPPV